MQEIPSPFWQPGKLSSEVKKEVDAIVKKMHPAVDRLCKLVRDQQVTCFSIEGTMYDVHVTFGICNPASHTENNSHEMVIPISSDSVHVLKILKDDGTPTKPPIASPGAPQAQPAGVSAIPADLLVGIQTVLKQMYPNVKDIEVLGTTISPHHHVAVEICRILEEARKRDRNEILRRVTELLNSLKS